ncbi:MAG TPA: Crp/Fnr family transcriptional regulator [Devosiaceae bacterium]|nr:Crp/Fnr family transcriptional regulator [Devosiaceae bacterium]
MNTVEALRRKLDSIGEVNEDAVKVLARLPYRLKELARGEAAASDGQRTTECCLLISGFMHRYKLVADGGRQILALHVSGDIPDLQSLHLHTMDHTLAATTRCSVAFIAHAAMTRLVHEAPEVGDLLWRDSLIDAAIFRTWILMMGRQPAYRHLAHLFCEMFVRSAAVGLAAGNSCPLPLTQEEIGDTLGLSIVHTNRSLQHLREEGLVRFEGFRLTVLDWQRLSAAAEFDPTYLHLRPRPDFDATLPLGRG